MAFSFSYGTKFQTVYYDNCQFHSLLELKFLLSIEESHAWLRDGIEIYYDEDTFQSTLFIKEGTRKYTPDFLIRDYYTGKATLVEVKPEGYDHYEKLAHRKQVSEHFTEYFDYDWEYKVVFSDKIKLTKKQSEKFEHIATYNQRPWFDTFCDEMSPSFNPFNLSITQYQNFVRAGVLPASFFL